ncbi:unnamed protein product [Brassica rapa]|uniref:phosphoethanolamine N-methyltransferase n=2 Tax=Brassica TaxID=3705 RepID=A0A817ALE7_BRANA|nr:unnamed protein product [Brassica napus]CAG7906281.1 unnamed protein product [Brassica rapa]
MCTTSTRSIRQVCSNYNSNNCEFLHPLCRSECRMLFQHCGGFNDSTSFEKLTKDVKPIPTDVLTLIPPYEGKRVLELGAIISRFTDELAQKAGEVIVLDFIEIAIKKKIEDGSVDLIFSNWLLMYLSDKEVKLLAERMLGWIFQECQTCDASGKSFELTMVCCKCIVAYVKNKKNQNQIYWIWQKVSMENDKDFRRFLNNVQYKSNGILRYECVVGQGYVSPRGFETTKEFVAKMELKLGQKVLDVDCGIGGGDFYMAETFDVHVVGIDLLVNMMSFAFERAIGLNCSVEFEVADCTTNTYPDNSFDVIYSSATIFHIQDKPALFKTFFKWLKPGGRVLITDYCKSDETPSPLFAEVIKQRGYDIHDVQAYEQMLKDAGFEDVIAEDRIDQYFYILSLSRPELEKVEKEKEEFIHQRLLRSKKT